MRCGRAILSFRPRHAKRAASVSPFRAPWFRTGGPSARSWSGGIYDESRRGWLASLEGEAHAAARAAFRVDDWNRYRIRAVGDRLRTWVNDVPCTDLIDDADASGLIALQVHTGGTGVIRWRDVRIAPIRPDAP